MTDPYDLNRFLQAQDPAMARVRQELTAGKKSSHWMWYVFPQLAGLGRSDMARKYAISSPAEARAYLDHSVLGPRLVELTEIVNRVEGRSIGEIFGSPDDVKFHSSMTLFALTRSDEPAFREALRKYFGGNLDKLTKEKLSAS